MSLIKLAVMNDHDHLLAAKKIYDKHNSKIKPYYLPAVLGGAAVGVGTGQLLRKYKVIKRPFKAGQLGLKLLGGLAGGVIAEDRRHRKLMSSMKQSNEYNDYKDHKSKSGMNAYVIPES